MSETLEFDLFRQNVMLRVKSAQDMLGLPIMLPSSPGNQPSTGVWAEFSLLLGKTGRAELGGGKRGLQRTTGVMQFTMLTPEQQGDGDLWRMANRVKRMFDEITVQCGAGGYFTTDTFNIQPLGGAAVRKGFLCLIVDGGVDFWSRNADADLNS